ncbi:hypothetical protein [Nevskia ramosa]|uniref:hypothetical protein n=1 Tax=Nevskia ramosa TaxID=64002 RepID=UPI002356F01F|nr:hypothetical protein [Nevskia ramosa]
MSIISSITQQATPDVHYRRIVGRDGITQRQTVRAGGKGAGSSNIRGNVAPPKPEDIITDDFGELVIRLPLTQGKHAVISLADFIELQSTHGTVWHAERRADRWYARAATSMKSTGKGSLVNAGRVLLGAGPGEAVRYRDGDPLNLRRSNLQRTYSGRASFAKREARLTIPTPAFLIPRVALETSP